MSIRVGPMRPAARGLEIACDGLGFPEGLRWREGRGCRGSTRMSGERVGPRGLRSAGPGDAAGVEQDAEAVVVEGAEAVAASLDLLDAQVQALGGAVAGAGVVVGQDLAPPRLEGLPSDTTSGTGRRGSRRSPCPTGPASSRSSAR